MGTVYLAGTVEGPSPAGFEGPVALKVVHAGLLADPDMLRRFQREAAAGHRVRHPNVVPTLDEGRVEVDGEARYFLAMEYVEGRTLRELLVEEGPFPEARLRPIGAQVAAGLEAVHAAGLVHRDLKPENLMAASDGRVRIMDLGMALVVDASITLTQEGQIAGSLLYAAPEQLRGAEVTPATDLYALGLVLYELVTGCCPYTVMEIAADVEADVQRKPPRLRDEIEEVTPFFDAVVTTLLAPDPTRRFASAAALQRALEEGESSSWWRSRVREALEGLRPRAGPPGTGERDVLEVAAVCGASFDPYLLAETLERPPVGILRTLTDIARRTGLVGVEGRTHRFESTAVRDVLYEEIDPALRRRHHGALARAAERRWRADGRTPSGVPASDVVFLAHHHLHGDRPATALPWLPRAIDLLCHEGRTPEAMALANGALAEPRLLRGTEGLALARQAARLLASEGRRDEARRRLERTHREMAPDDAAAPGWDALLAELRP